MSTICYHGTSKKNVLGILKNGFNPDTWFAANLQNALGYGGCFIFEVCFEDIWDGEKPNWQFHYADRIPISQIVGLKEYKISTLKENAKLRNEIFEYNLARV